MGALVIVSDEKQELIFAASLDQGDDMEAPFPVLFGYAALDAPALSSYEGHSVYPCTAVTGHKFVLVCRDIRLAVDKFLSAAEKALNEELMRSTTTEGGWLSESFGTTLRELYRTFQTS